MKGKIDLNGVLHIQRGVRMRNEICPFASGYMGNTCNPIVDCGDHCPLFGEPDSGPIDTHRGKTFLSICQGRTIEFDYFTDERAKP